MRIPTVRRRRTSPRSCDASPSPLIETVTHRPADSAELTEGLPPSCDASSSCPPSPPPWPSVSWAPRPAPINRSAPPQSNDCAARNSRGRDLQVVGLVADGSLVCFEDDRARSGEGDRCGDRARPGHLARRHRLPAGQQRALRARQRRRRLHHRRQHRPGDPPQPAQPAAAGDGLRRRLQPHRRPPAHRLEHRAEPAHQRRRRHDDRRRRR